MNMLPEIMDFMDMRRSKLFGNEQIYISNLVIYINKFALSHFKGTIKHVHKNIELMYDNRFFFFKSIFIYSFFGLSSQ